MREEVVHACRYRKRWVWSDWTVTGALAERLARRVPVCDVCERAQPARRLRPVVMRELRAEIAEAPPLADAAGRIVASALARRGGGPEAALSAAGVLGDLARRGLPASLAGEWIERFMRAGWLTEKWRLGSPPRLVAVVLRDPQALRELAQPGEDARRRDALREAQERIAGLTHPKAREIATILAGPEAADVPPLALQALAALAVNVEAGDVLAERVFSARHLGSSKALAGLRGRLERLVGPLSGIGIREGARITLLGGAGILRLAGGREIDLCTVAPFVGLSREAVEGLDVIRFPAAGLVAVENLATFEACCRGEVEGTRGALIIWSAGYPGPPVRRVVELAAAAGAPLRIWADLDLDGVRIARLLAAWHPSGATFYCMSPGDLTAAPRHQPLSARSLAAIRRDLAERPNAPLAGTLQAMLDSGRWVEQEAFLAGHP